MVPLSAETDHLKRASMRMKAGIGFVVGGKPSSQIDDYHRRNQLIINEGGPLCQGKCMRPHTPLRKYFCLRFSFHMNALGNDSLLR